MKSKKTKKALSGSVLALVLCFVMLIGTTFAWFTSSDSTAVNKIQAGELKVDIVDESGTSLENQSLTWQKASGHEGESTLWEPGVTYKTNGFKIKNDGNLALKYNFAINGLNGDSELLDVIEFSVVKAGETDEAVALDSFVGNLEAGTATEPKTSDAYYIEGTMKTTASNAYQGKSLKGIGITVYATQDTVEYDSNTKDYDKDATLPDVNATPVANATELETAINAGESVVLTSDINITNDSTENTKVRLNITKDSDIDLNGFTLNMGKINLTANGSTVTVSNGTIVGSGNKVVIATDGADVTLTNCTIKNTEKHGVSVEKSDNAADGSDSAPMLTLNNCTIEAKEFAVSVFDGGKAIINSGTYTSYDNCVIGTNGNEAYESANITINGGTFNGYIQSSGYIACGIYMAHPGDVVTVNGGTFNITNGVGLLARNGAATVDDSVVWNITGSTMQGKVGDAGTLVTAGTAYAYENGTINNQSSD